MIIGFFVLVIIGFIYRPWITPLTLSSGDWPYLFLENIKEFPWRPEIRFLWLAPYYQILTKVVVQYLHVPWEVAEKVFWFLPFIILSLLGSYKLTKSALGALIYTTNTYALMIVGGGQMGVVMAYALSPIVLNRLTSLYNKNLVLNALVLAIQVMFDPRIALLTVVAIILYHAVVSKIGIKDFFTVLGIPIVIAIILHLYWIVPLLTSQAPVVLQLGEATSAAVKFLSFAAFEQTISLLHPNWPENIFGKVYFMRPEFLVVPMLAFGSLLCISKIKNQKDKDILFFAFLSLLGAFLAKGTNPPFGGIYLWLFENIPGFTLFRDPTKFYIFVALAFSVLIPYVLKKMSKGKIVSLLFVIFWGFTIREALLGQLTGTFKPMPVPQEYVRLKDFLISQPEAFQILWIPQRQRFGFASTEHPAIDAQSLSREASILGILAWVHREHTQQELTEVNVKYVIVPYDSRGELFLTDRTHDEAVYRTTIDQLAAIPWLGKLGTFSQIGVFEVLK